MDTTKHRDLLHWKSMVLEATKNERGEESGPASPGARRETATTSEKRTFLSFPRDFPSHHHTRICYLNGETRTSPGSIDCIAIRERIANNHLDLWTTSRSSPTTLLIGQIDII